MLVECTRTGDAGADKFENRREQRVEVKSRRATRMCYMCHDGFLGVEDSCQYLYLGTPQTPWHYALFPIAEAQYWSHHSISGIT